MPTLRLATPGDAPGIRAIYAPFVESTAVSFERDVPSVEDIAGRVRSVLERHPWLVCVDGDEVAGYAYATSFRARPAYSWSAETSVYVAADHRGRGVGRAAMEGLLGCLRIAGFRRAIAGATMPNAASEALHLALGFRPAGHFARVGHKLGRWHDVAFWDLALDPEVEEGGGRAEPRATLAPAELARREDVRALFAAAAARVRSPT